VEIEYQGRCFTGTKFFGAFWSSLDDFPRLDDFFEQASLLSQRDRTVLSFNIS
jgi:hypothetical protein